MFGKLVDCKGLRVLQHLRLAIPADDHETKRDCEMKPKLIVIGANYLQLPLILRARDLGIEIHTFAWEEGAVGKDASDRFYPISITETEDILQEAKSIRPDGIATIASDLAVVTVNYLTNELGLTGNSLEATHCSTNKYRMRQELADHCLPCPRFVRARSASEVDLTGLAFPLIVKPTDRSGSKGVTKVDDGSGVPGALERALSESFQAEAIIEEFVEGREISIEMISWEGRHHFLAVTDKVTSGAPNFVEKAHHQPADLPPDVIEDVCRVVRESLDCLGIEFGASHSELLITQDHSTYVVEIAGRMGGDFIGAKLVELSTGYDFVKGVIDVAMGRRPDVRKTRHDFAGIYYLDTPPGKVMEIRDHSEQYAEVIAWESLVRIGDSIGPVRESADRPGYFLYHSTAGRFCPGQDVIEIITVPENDLTEE